MAAKILFDWLTESGFPPRGHGECDNTFMTVLNGQTFYCALAFFLSVTITRFTRPKSSPRSSHERDKTHFNDHIHLPVRSFPNGLDC